ncbi:thioesterase II family protein [Streptomyces sp. NBC_00390]|uniref:thioesterase II family protein n=1 Tax=Streptomyces sp. NBC_00390 TaxID=2975736 RepID=UPI003FCC292F
MTAAFPPPDRDSALAADRTRTVLVLVPFAGAGASFFKPWQAHAPQGIQVLPVQLPGREERFTEPAYTDAAAAADEVYARLSGELRGGARVAVFGHSMGAVLGFELAHRLEADAGVRFERLVVSGAPGPWTGRTEHAHALSDDDFLARVRVFAGYAHPALENAEMRELLLPTLRADVRLHETYAPSTDRLLSVPVTSLRGRDDELVSAFQAAQWSVATTGKLTTPELPGGHMYLTENAATVLELIAAELGTGREAEPR